MGTFLAIVVAVIALVMAIRARNEVRELREWIADDRRRRGAERRAGDPPAVQPAPSRREPEPAPMPSRPVAGVTAAEAAAPQRPPEPPPPVTPPTPPAPPTPPPPAAPATPPFWQRVDWESFVGVKLFSWVAGIALVIAAIYFLKYSVEHGWVSPPVRAAIGLLTGSALLVICELRIARDYKFTANAMHGAGIAILYATLFAVHALWHLLPSGVVFAAMLVVTAVAVGLSIRRDSLFIALLGMMGGFATPALLSTGENRPVGLFSYLLLLNAGLAWVAYKKRWPALTAGSVVFSIVYQWAWVAKFLDAAQLPLAAAIFLVFAGAAAAALWMRRDDAQQTLFDRAGQFGVALPLLFALFAASVPAYGVRYNILFTFLLLMSAGLAFIAIVRKVEWLHAIGGVATLLTFALWLLVSYTPAAWPAILGWTSAFAVLYLAAGTRIRGAATLTAPALLFVFAALVQLEPRSESALLLFGVLFLLFALAAAYALRYRHGAVYFVAAFFAIVTQGLWSASHLRPELLYEALVVYAAFGLAFVAVPALARRFERVLRPVNGINATIIASMVMLLFLTFDDVAPAALWGMAIVLAALFVGAVAQARATARPLLVTTAVIVAWLVLASWWEGATLSTDLLPALFAIGAFGIIIVATAAWGRFERQTHLALAGHAFLLFVAASRALAFPPWPFLAVLLVLDLALGAVALYLRRGSLVVGAAVMSQVVLLAWSTNTDATGWANVALAATLAVAAYAGAFLKLTPRAAMAALLLGHVVAITAGATADAPLFATLLATHAILAVATLAVAAYTEQHALAVISVPFTAVAAMLAQNDTPARSFTFAAVLYAIYVAYPLVLGARAKRALEPYLAPVLASVPFFFIARTAMKDAGIGYAIGVLPVALAIVMLVLLVRLLRLEAPPERFLTRLAVVAAAALAFVTVAIPLQLEKQWITIGWALEGAALAWLFRRIPHRGLLAWGASLLAAAFVRLTVNPAVFAYHASGQPILNWYLYTYVVCAMAFFAAAHFAPREYAKGATACRAAGALLLFFLLNIEIADYYSTGTALAFNFLSSSLAQDLTYTIGWALFAIGMLVAGIVFRTRAARVASIALLVVTIFKCFIHDLARLGGLYRIASFLGLALALVMVSVLLQKFVLSRRAAEEVPS